MSVYRKHSINTSKNKINDDSQKESPLSILKLENNNLNNELKLINNLITKLKSENLKTEQEKSLLLSNNKKIDNNLIEIKKQLDDYNNQLIELKNKEKEKEININTQSLDNNKQILEMQNKITDLELRLKLSEQKIFAPLEEGKNSCFEIINKEKNLDNSNEVIEELNKAKIMNQNLIEKIKEQKKNFENVSNEKNNIIKQLNEYNKDKKKLEILIGKKEEDINQISNKENKLKRNISIQTNENMKIKNNINIIKTKCNNLIKEKYNLEDIVIKQEEKINGLNKSINEVRHIMNIKDNEISKDKIYIKNLKDVINDLKKEYKHKNIKKNKNLNQNKGLFNLRIKLNDLKNQGQNIININNINNINNKNYFYNNSINNLYKINIGKNPKYNNKMNIRYRNEKNNNSFLRRIDPKNNMYFSKNTKNYYEINTSQKNKSLPNVERSTKRPKDIQIYKIIKNKNKLILNKRKNFNFLEEQKIKNDENLKPRLLKQNLDLSNEEDEKEKMEEVKGLFDKIIFDFDN